MLPKNLDNAHLTITSLKSESSKLKTCKTKLEADVKKLEKLPIEVERKKKKEHRPEKRDQNSNIEKSDMKNQNKEVEEDSFLISSTCSSMISHWNLHNTKEFQIPFSLSSMIAHLHHAPHVTASLSDPSNSFSKATSNKEIELEEKPEGLIGPRLPRMLTDEKCEALLKKLFGENIIRGLLAHLQFQINLCIYVV